jgi:CheY-like chemotaxis protein
MSGDLVLVVDDNPANLKLVRVLLQAYGYDVKTATDAEEAQAQVASFRPRLILMDLQLPGMDGIELTRRLKAAPATRDTRIVALTAYAMKGDEEKARAAGFDGYVTKPIDVDLLPGLVASWLAPGRGSGIA